jgi:hypothetical protein
MYEQAAIPVGDPQRFSAVKSAVETSFSSGRVKEFLKSLDRQKIRIREFEDVLIGGFLGPSAAADYSKLGNGDQGQIREFYLATLEKVAPELRSKFLKLYSYY